MRLEPFRVLRMSASRKVLVPPFVETYAEIIERGAVRVEAFPVRPVHRNELRHDVDDLTELCFLLPDLFFCRLTLGDVGYRADELAMATGIPQNVGYGVDVLNSIIRQEQAIGMLEICRARKRAISDLFEVGAVLA